VVVKDVWQANYGYLPEPLRDLMRLYYRKKTELKGDPEQEYYHVKSKNKLNSGYGMCAQDPMPDKIKYDQLKIDTNGGFVFDAADPGKWNKAKGRYWLNYAWGVWVTAWARYRLWEGRQLIRQRGGVWLYGDTDSNKYLGRVDWSEYNALRIRDSEANGAYADDANGIRHYMGVYESEGHFDRFLTWGAKKYAYEDRHGLHITVSGVNKKLGAEELAAAGGLDAFLPGYYDEEGRYHKGFVFVKGGGTESRYDDLIDEWVTIDGHQLHITRNVSIVPSTYKLSLSKEYRELIRYQVINGTEDVLRNV
jgi:hypothetical protein